MKPASFGAEGLPLMLMLPFAFDVAFDVVFLPLMLMLPFAFDVAFDVVFCL